jgi:hypothetical protein
MLALLDPRAWLVALALLAGAYGTGRWQQWRSDEKAQVNATLKATQAARDREAAWQSDAQTITEVHDGELRRIAAQHARDLAGVRDRAARMPEAARASCAGVTGAELSSRDAVDLVGLATRADAVRADLEACRGWVKAVTQTDSH